LYNFGAPDAMVAWLLAARPRFWTKGQGEKFSRPAATAAFSVGETAAGERPSCGAAPFELSTLLESLSE
jgi:hypothetical protein